MVSSEQEQDQSPHDPNAKRWVETWKRAGPKLAAIKARELRAFDYAANLERLDEMLDWACEHARPRLTSGLVEQQRLFQILRRRQEQNDADGADGAGKGAS